ncbi:hypothetical protein KEJ15_00065 [Candidatus Bathyarchaeota archaeon]|nr:hypothetical protein [Candidatus Bathyarchaeota archaeon]
MEKVGILVVVYGSREAAVIDAFSRSQSYHVELYVADMRQNPFNIQKAAKHIVIPDLNVGEICKFAEKNKDIIDFGVVCPEKPIIEGVRDLVEKQTGIPMICPTKECAIEASKIQQRMLFQEIIPKVNPRFKIFDPKNHVSSQELKRTVYSWLDELANNAVVKPDRPAAGKGVGVWGDHFTSREQLFEHFLSNYQHGAVIIEEKIEGEESSFQALCDGKHLIALPDTRDYKRAFDDDKGPNTGGMGSYKDKGETLPFLTNTEREQEKKIVTQIFEKWKTRVSDPSSLRGIPLYAAFMHTGKHPKILENNSRPGDPEIINILPTIKDDFVDVCFKILEGNLTKIELEKVATVTAYKVPPGYGDYMTTFPSKVDKAEVGSPVDLSEAYTLSRKYKDRLRIYPASVEQRGNQIFALKSRTVAVLGVADSIEEARQISLEGINAIKGGALWNRTDIASKHHIEKCVKHMEELRRRK